MKTSSTLSPRAAGLFLVLLVLGLVLGAPSPARAGAIQEIVNLTGFEPSPVAGEVIAPLVPLHWDERCLPVEFRINDTLDPVPNPLGEDFLSIEQVTAAFQTAAQRWNEVPTSYYELRIGPPVSNPGLRRFDQINEVTFRTFNNVFPPVPPVVLARGQGTPIAIARPLRILVDFFFSDGLDIDGDGDADVSAAIDRCQDVDGDGDTEFPEGDYDAGTILDVDIVLNAGLTGDGTVLPGYRFTVDPEDADTDPRSVDLVALAVQTLGMSQGISHSATSQTSTRDGASATLFASLDTSDPRAELASRNLDFDAVATTSLAYPEGTASEGPAALQPGDLAPEEVFGFITGEVLHGARDEPIVGANVIAIDVRDGRVVSTALSGEARFSVTPDGTTATFLDADYHVRSGRYVLAVPPGEYHVAVEPIDGQPVPPTSFNLVSILGNILGQNDFDEEFYDGRSEAAVELRPGARVAIPVGAGDRVTGVDFVTNRTRGVEQLGSFDRSGFRDAAPGTWYAVRIPAGDLLAAAREIDAGGDVGDGVLVLGAKLFTEAARDGDLPRFDDALLTTGTVEPDGTARLDLGHPLVRRSPFVGQDNDFTPLWFDDTRGLSAQIGQGIARGEIGDLFLALRLPSAPAGGTDAALPLIGLDGNPNGNDVPIDGRSYTSTTGDVFHAADDFNFLFDLVLGEAP